jgi:hypothetical protein
VIEQLMQRRPSLIALEGQRRGRCPLVKRHLSLVAS